MLGLQDIGVPALALTSLTSKEDQNAAYKRLDTDLDICLVYGEQTERPMHSARKRIIQVPTIHRYDPLIHRSVNLWRLSYAFSGYE